MNVSYCISLLNTLHYILVVDPCCIVLKIQIPKTKIQKRQKLENILFRYLCFHYFGLRPIFFTELINFYRQIFLSFSNSNYIRTEQGWEWDI